jgi:hypothetical protein
MRYDDSLTEDSRRALSLDSEEGTADGKRALSATLSDPFTTRQDSDLPPTGHVRVKAKYDAYDGQQDAGRVAGRRAARTEQPQEDGADGQRRRQAERKSSLTGMRISDVQSFPRNTSHFTLDAVLIFCCTLASSVVFHICICLLCYVCFGQLILFLVSYY